jgi:hypothetical protein
MDAIKMDPAFRHLLKLKEMASKEKVSTAIQAEIDKVIDLTKVSLFIYLLDFGAIGYFSLVKAIPLQLDLH